jgi:hypothetical protein
VESKYEVYEKNNGIDFKKMIQDLRDHGVAVLASGILFLEHHDKQTIWEDIEFMVDLKSDSIQFMELGPLPGTRLYEQYDAKDLMRKDMPYEEWHGQHRIWFKHPHFTPEESEQILKQAFCYDFDVQGSSLLRMCETAIRGIKKLSGNNDPRTVKRRESLKEQAETYRLTFKILRKYAHNETVRSETEKVIAMYEKELGPASFKQKAIANIALLYAARESKRIKQDKNFYQPKTMETRFRM